MWKCVCLGPIKLFSDLIPFIMISDWTASHSVIVTVLLEKMIPICGSKRVIAAVGYYSRAFQLVYAYH